MTIASYCTTFLKPEMLHIYRQITGLRDFETFVLTKSRENPELFPCDAVEILPRPRINFLSRFEKKYLRRLEPVFYRGEYAQLDAVLTRRHADLLHVYFGHTGVHLLPFVRHWPGPTVVSFHGMDIMLRDREPGYNDRLRQLIQTVPLVLARSESLARRLTELGADPARIRLNRTGIPLDDFPFIARTVPTDGAWHLVQAARLIEKKGIDQALHAFATFRKTHPAATFTIAGDGKLRSDLEKLTADLGLTSAVNFVGFQTQPELRALYERSHIFIHPSQTTDQLDQEGVPNSMLEAMATGLPVIATHHGGIPEAVTDCHDGYLTPERDPAALVESLGKLTANYATSSHHAAQSVRQKFSTEASITALESHYREAITMRRNG
jgi:colanic acid/amylovoran biosynthesis glycosyltransferase